ncbi:MAG: Vitamin B12 import ATP-binding protein BtuD [Acidimicrobiales bacterium]|nr:Vitamin B12 import ATP-binding protein BtuD [Acidimicrobiales bacterium]
MPEPLVETSHRGAGDEVVIRTNGLSRAFRKGLALDSLSIDVPAGRVLALLGPNGAGKTTTVRLLNGVLEPTAGQSRVLGLDPVAEGDELRRRTGVLTEQAGLDDRLTARENLLFTARVRGMRGQPASSRVDHLIESFGMGEYAYERTQGFSTGQRKRLALARSLIHDPEVLFLDEPTSGLDPTATREVIDLIAGLATRHGRAVVLCTHFLGEAGRLADEMAVLHRGRLLAFGPPAALAARLWPGLEAELDLGGPASDTTVEALRSVDGVLAAHNAPMGARVTVTGREVLPRLVARLVAHEIPVYASTPLPKTLEDVYFEIAGRIPRDGPGLGGIELGNGTEPAP